MLRDLNWHTQQPRMMKTEHDDDCGEGSVVQQVNEEGDEVELTTPLRPHYDWSDDDFSIYTSSADEALSSIHGSPRIESC